MKFKLESSTKRFTGLLLMIPLGLLLGIPSAPAQETQDPKTFQENPQATVAATPVPDSEKALAQALDTFEASNSVDFLMEKPPMTQSTSPSAASPTLVPPMSQQLNPGTVTLQVLQGLPFQRTDEVAMLVSEKCSQTGTATDGTNSCSRVYSNGHHATILTQNANEGDELKQQTVIEEFDSDQTLLFRKTIRHRLDYNYWNDQKAKEKEFFDIIDQPAGKKTTREFMVYEYFLDTGKTKSLSWTQYQQVGNEPKAELTYHAMLRYGDDGSPDRGIAEQWAQGKKTETFMNWSRRSKGFATLDETNWGQWESWIQNVSLQAYLP
ncbi:MAG: hypothetical protein V1882_09405 [Candidatus Omnitrophota bacterium]